MLKKKKNVYYDLRINSDHMDISLAEKMIADSIDDGF